MHQDRFGLDVRKNFFMERVVKHSCRLPGKWWSHYLWKCSRNDGTWQLVLWFSCCEDIWSKGWTWSWRSFPASMILQFMTELLGWLWILYRERRLVFPKKGVRKSKLAASYFCFALESCEWEDYYSCIYKENNIFSKVSKTKESLKIKTCILWSKNIWQKNFVSGTLLELSKILLFNILFQGTGKFYA